MTGKRGQRNNTAQKRIAAMRKPAREKKAQSCRWSDAGRPGISTVATWEWDFNAGVCHYSSEWMHIIGADAAETPSPRNWSWWSGRMHMDDMPEVLETHRRIFAGELEEAEVLFRLQRPDGRWIRIVSRGVVSQWNDDGTPAVMSGVAMDISHHPVDPPLPEDGDTPGPAEYSGNTAATALAETVADMGEQRSRLNERRLGALYQLAQMDNAAEDEVLHFAMTSILQLTNSASGFLFIPDNNGQGRGRLFWSRDHYIRTGRPRLPSDFLPKDIKELAAGADPLTAGPHVVNGDGKTPLYILFNGSMPVMRYILMPGVEEGRTVWLAGVSNKAAAYDESDLRQVETFVNNAWLILRRRRHMRDLSLAKEAAEAANKAKGEFLANVSHELRTPLNGILSMLQLLEDFPMTEEQRGFLHAADISGTALMRIISDILDFSRIDSGKMELVKEVFDFKASVLSGLRLFRREAEEKGLSFTLEMDPAIPELLLGDDTRVRQILFNLVGNALKFTWEGGITVVCGLAPEQQAGKVAISLTVTDTGIGIPKDRQGELFKAFAQIDSFISKKVPGTGLGLSIVKRLVEMMDGHTAFESEPGSGTSVRCVIALDAYAPSLEQEAVLPPPVCGHRGEPLNILVAEDDAVSRFALRSFLVREGHRAVCVQNGRQALEALQLYPFDCLLTDIQMPDMDGLELVRRIHGNEAAQYPPSEEVRALVREVFAQTPVGPVEVNPDIIIVAISAHAMAGDRERFLREGINYYIAKPITLRQLNSVLAEITGRLA